MAAQRKYENLEKSLTVKQAIACLKDELKQGRGDMPVCIMIQDPDFGTTPVSISDISCSYEEEEICWIFTVDPLVDAPPNKDEQEKIDAIVKNMMLSINKQILTGQNNRVSRRSAKQQQRG